MQRRPRDVPPASRRTRFEPHLRPQTDDRRILHARLVVDVPERDRLVDQHHRQRVLDVDVRRPAVVGDRSRLVADDDLLDLVRIDRLLLQQRLDRVERRVDRMSHRPFLDVRARQLVALAELVDQQFGLAGRRVGEDEVVGSGHDVVHGVPAGVDEQHRRHAAARRHAAEDEPASNTANC